ncbi:acylphosphatase-1-like protein [Fimicolochytrium jonesii]|uniref:acylphosphatase-1-like protein n=1 Tax=Fimicolochytrium jonesii TaxID=1396493 RepID=UPI0022FE2C16|nr:acylphosphatase-1-like protein [Fimicolochytrium jonesii]KAI8823003.1 acylphosphatase-1-like protein [Fimicolochytrium jonesii]
MATSSPTLLNLSFEVFGKVQGVFFRKYTVEKATRLGIVGWVRNTDRGTVEGVGQGTKGPVDALETFKQDLKKGSPQSTVERVDIKEENPIDAVTFPDFEKRKNVRR